MQERILDFIDKFHKERGFYPSQSEIAKGLKESRQVINYHFKDMSAQLGDNPVYARFFV